MLNLKNLASSNTGEGRVSASFRGRRFGLFSRLVANRSRPIRILDLGGKEPYWSRLGVEDDSEYAVTLLNLEEVPTTLPGFRSMAGDATDLSSIDLTEFDILHSNSTIEHLFTWESQRKMAAEIVESGLPYWVQTPNYWFPIEPHFHWLGWQWYPRWMRIAMLRRVRCGFRGPVPDRDEAARHVDEVRLLSAREMRSLFPNATLYSERIGPLTKSLVVHWGLES